MLYNRRNEAEPQKKINENFDTKLSIETEPNKELFGTKRSMVVDGKEVPLGKTVDAAKRHMKMTKTTLKSVVVHTPEPTNNLLFSTK